MRIKVFVPNEKGKIEFTREELEKLLNDTYAEGQRNCNCGSNITWTNPYTTPYINCSDSTTTNALTKNAPTTATIALNSADAREMSKHIDEIIKNTTAKMENDAFLKLAKELNF
jgi:hypothetical protein